jgi:hypothetical protein
VRAGANKAERVGRGAGLAGGVPAVRAGGISSECVCACPCRISPYPPLSQVDVMRSLTNDQQV